MRASDLAWLLLGATLLPGCLLDWSPSDQGGAGASSATAPCDDSRLVAGDPIAPLMHRWWLREGETGTCYVLVGQNNFPDRRSWSAAVQECTADPGRHLAAATDVEELALVTSLIATSGVSAPDGVHLGADRDLDVSPDFRWITGEPWTLGQDVWAVGEPTDAATKQCVSILAGNLYVQGCSANRSWLCELPD